uniref:Uncharacterized protein n=1 Tax=Hommersandiophycus borowitzkae TaxID=268573 RepID=A0A1G4NU68_9FLOR|nr:Hypothetical protein ORF_11 [Hommersandiophycus borowitzkae]SCW22243.1 Hypothetical protein ORF_11 [Hommersandiophycus borowitzkae]
MLFNCLYYHFNGISLHFNIHVLVYISDNSIYNCASLDCSKSSIDFLTSVSNSSYKYYGLTLLLLYIYVLLPVSIIDDQYLYLQVLSSNKRAITVYIWLGFKIIYVQKNVNYMNTYVKLKIEKSKIKNTYRRCLLW